MSSTSPRVTDEGLDPATLQDRAVRGSVWTAISAVVGLPAAFLANVVVARALGTVDYGHVVFLTASMGLVGTVSNLGVTGAAVQFGAASDSAGRYDDTVDLLQRVLGYHYLIQMPVKLLAAYVLARGEPRYVIGCLVVAIVLDAAMSTSLIALTSENRTALGARVSMGTNMVVQAMVVLAALITRLPAAVWSIRLLTESLMFPVFALVGRRGRRLRLLRPRAPRGFPAGFWRYALGSAGAGLVATLVFSRSEVFLLEALGQPEALGVFALAFGIAIHITAPLDALLNPMLPATAGLAHNHSARLPAAFSRATRLAAVLASWLLAVAVPPLVLLVPALYGEDFAPAAALLVPLAAVSCLQSTAIPATAFVHARRRTGQLLRANVVALVTGTALAAALIPPYGAWGAVIGNVVGQLTALAVLIRSELRAEQLQVRDYLWMIRPALAGLLALAAALLAGWAVPGEGPLVSLLAAGLAMPVGAVALIVAATLMARGSVLPAERDTVMNVVPRPARLPVSWLFRWFFPSGAPRTSRLTRDRTQRSR